MNRKDRLGKSVFEGGFLGLDNIGVFDRSAELPTGGHLEQADGTAWMAMFCQNMFEIAVELAAHDPSYDDLVFKFAEHFLWIGAAMNKVGDDGMWDEEDGFYYDVLRLPDGSGRAAQGPLAGRAAAALRDDRDRTVAARARAAGRRRRSQTRFGHIPELLAASTRSVRSTRMPRAGPLRRSSIADRLRRILSRMLDEQEFLSPLRHPLGVEVARAASLRRARWAARNTSVAYQPAESDSGDVRRQLQLARAGVVPDERPADSRAVPVPRLLRRLLPRRVSDRLGQADDALRGRRRRSPIACSASSCATTTGRRPVFGGTEKFQHDPHWRDCIPFYEYFHGDNGAGLGASHQTGWTALVAALAQMFGTVDARTLFEAGRQAAVPKNASAARVSTGRVAVTEAL